MLDDLIEHFGNQSELARALGIWPCNVNVWYHKKTFPYKHLIKIEELTGGKFKAVDLLEYQSKIIVA